MLESNNFYIIILQHGLFIHNSLNILSALAHRPDYKQLGILKHRFPEVPIIALTATATQDVVNDVKKILRIERCVLFKSPFNRPNLNYSVVAKSERGEAVLKQIAALIHESYRGEAGIVYCFSKKECAAVAKYLNAAGVRAAEYHADLSPDQRQRTHNRWYQNQVHVVVATVAFGMVWVQLVLHEKNISLEFLMYCQLFFALIGLEFMNLLGACLFDLHRVSTSPMCAL